MPAEITPQYGRDTDPGVLDIRYLADEWLRQRPPGVWHAIDGHYGVESTLKEISTQDMLLSNMKVLPWKLRLNNGKTIEVNRYQYRF